MRKLLLLLLPFFILSCSNQVDKIISSVSSEAGSPEQTKKFNEKQTYVKWEKVSLGKSNTIKNALDKSFGALPTETVELKQSFDELGNAILGEFDKYWIYENSTSKVELDYTYKEADKNNMLVELHITEK